MQKLLAGLILLIVNLPAFSQALSYSHPVQYFKLPVEGKFYSMAYMDVPAAKPNGETVVLLHGKNFNGYYWKDVINVLAGAGYRVIVPDQLGWGKSDKPYVHYSFSLLAHNTKKLLDTLGISKANIVAHSMGGMLAVKFSIQYPGMVSRLVLENPIGLEDYSLFVPYQPTDSVYQKEKQATYESLKKYQQTYYPVWKPEYEQYVQAQADAGFTGNKDSIAFVNALTYQVIYDQPVVSYFSALKAPTLLIIGQEDRTVVGKNLLTENEKKLFGQYPQLGRKTQQLIKNAKLIEMKGVGHIPHIQELQEYSRHLLSFLKTK